MQSTCPEGTFFVLPLSQSLFENYFFGEWEYILQYSGKKHTSVTWHIRYLVFFHVLQILAMGCGVPLPLLNLAYSPGILFPCIGWCYLGCKSLSTFFFLAVIHPFSGKKKKKHKTILLLYSRHLGFFFPSYNLIAVLFYQSTAEWHYAGAWRAPP